MAFHIAAHNRRLNTNASSCWPTFSKAFHQVWCIMAQKGQKDWGLTYLWFAAELNFYANNSVCSGGKRLMLPILNSTFKSSSIYKLDLIHLNFASLEQKSLWSQNEWKTEEESGAIRRKSDPLNTTQTLMFIIIISLLTQIKPFDWLEHICRLG